MKPRGRQDPRTPVAIRIHARFAGRIRRARLEGATARALSVEKQRGAPASRRAVGAMLKSVDPGLTVYITTDSEIRLLNRKFHATNAVTDVLSFPSNDPDYLGDIVISFERARAQARLANWSIAEEVDLLAVHGVLHLLGYDDVTPQKRARMWKRQQDILGELPAIGE